MLAPHSRNFRLAFTPVTQAHAGIYHSIRIAMACSRFVVHFWEKSQALTRTAIKDAHNHKSYKGLQYVYLLNIFWCLNFRAALGRVRTEFNVHFKLHTLFIYKKLSDDSPNSQTDPTQKRQTNTTTYQIIIVESCDARHMIICVKM